MRSQGTDIHMGFTAHFQSSGLPDPTGGSLSQNNVLVFGIDPSLTCTGMAVLVLDEVVDHAAFLTKPTVPAFKRTVDLIDDLMQYMDKYDPTKIGVSAIEGYAYSRRAHGSEYQAELGGVLRYRLVQEGRQFCVVPPTSVKKFVTKSGAATKSDVKLCVFQLCGIELSGKKGEAMADALAIALTAKAGLEALRGIVSQDQPKYQKDAVKKLLTYWEREGQTWFASQVVSSVG